MRPSFYRMIFDIIRFNKQATQFYLDHKDSDSVQLTLEQYLHENNYSKEFTEHYIMPMGAAIWSASRDEMKNFPLQFFVRFFHHHGMLTVNDRPQWRVIKGGSASYIPKLTENFKNRIHLNSPVQSVRREHDCVEITTHEGIHKFEEVIFASHADEVRLMLQSPTPSEKSVLEGFSYRPNDVILHTDTSVLPQSQLGHASWNYFIPENPQDRVAITYHMNILQGISSPETFLVSLNMDEFIQPEKIIKRIPYMHPVFNLEAIKSQSRWSEVSGRERIHFCGAYWGNGFHEDGVASALKVVKKLEGK